ncbi:MAG TPA: UDP-N-acetylmuramoyl-L-alanyl-D-glutamate--2,6-diaminopimelate ligase [Stellaceae bacterium]|nr:UDP-N-acetylmuramoyl-L-alanyl-D-glutamate--2,6-diaminopimelate ligase [Stellaceae bacterium]
MNPAAPLPGQRGPSPEQPILLAGPGNPDPEILGITADSRQVRPGYLFAALRGTRSDGRAFANEAVGRGAVAILTDDAAALALKGESRTVAVVTDRNPHRRLSLFASRFFGRQPATVAAVTGTNGKTSVAHFTREIWTALGRPAASLGTLGLVSPDGRRAGALTTPDPVALHRDLYDLARGGVEHAVIEASSHGLHQYRLDGVAVTAAAFTNLTRDHLDYHGDMDAYRAAKDRLFADLLVSRGRAVLNADSPEFARLAELCRIHDHDVISYGVAERANLRLRERLPLPTGQKLALELYGERRETTLPLVGDFQALNVLAALGLVIACGSELAPAAAALERLTGVPGRMQPVGATPDGSPVFVDYAHTPDALATVLNGLRPHTQHRLVVVFGAGGDRDRGKRPLMGETAARLADQVYVTDDNPRSEDPAAIRHAIIAAAPGAIEIGDRRAAIGAAIEALRAGDVLVIAGKGHETGQIVGTEVHPFDDAVVAREALASGARR